MKKLILIGSIFCLSSLAGLESASAASKEGALAYNDSTGAYGFSYNYPSTSEAERRALNECGSGCSVVLNFSGGSCGSFYKGSNSYGWGTAPTIGSARNRAQQECNSRGSGCSERVWGCNSR